MKALRCAFFAVLAIAVAGCSTSEVATAPEEVHAIGPKGMGAADSLGYTLHKTQTVAAKPDTRAPGLVAHPAGDGR